MSRVTILLRKSKIQFHQFKMTIMDYTQLKKQTVLSVGANERHRNKVHSLKELFRSGINSVRRFEQINSIGQLLKVLEIRDLLSENNIEPLKDIAREIGDNELLKHLCEYEVSHMPREFTKYYDTENSFKETSEGHINTSPFTASMSKRKKDRIFKTVIEEIGTFWRDLARNLKVRECVIDKIDVQHNSLSIKASKMLEVFESRADPQRWFFVLCDALDQSRRKDLTRSLHEIIVMNI